MKKVFKIFEKLFEIPSRDVYFASGKHRKMAFVLALILIMSSLIIGWNYYDIMWWVSWYRIVQREGASAVLFIYTLCQPPTCKVPYPPLAVLIFVSVYAIAMLVPYQFRYIILKLCLVIVPALIIFYIIKKRRGFDIALIWLLSLPLIQVLFALQFDVLIAMLILLSTIYITKKEYSKASIVLALATLIKHICVIILPLHIIFTYRENGLRKAFEYLLTFSMIALLFCMPFYIVSREDFINNLISFHASRPPQDLSIWALPTYLLEYGISTYSSILNILWIIPLAVTCLATLYIAQKEMKKMLKHDDALTSIALFTSLLLLLFITFNKVGNLNYLVWFVPTSLIALNLRKIKNFVSLTAILVLFIALPYSLLLWCIPATDYRQSFIAEDVGYWDARTVFTQSINYYIIYTAGVFQRYAIMPIRMYVPSDVLDFLEIIKMLNAIKRILVAMLIILAQPLLISLIYLHSNVLKSE
jgi:uncharacterized membrane protein